MSEVKRIGQRDGATGRSVGAYTYHVVATPEFKQLCRASVKRLPPNVRKTVEVSVLGRWERVCWSEIKKKQCEQSLLVCCLADIPENAPAAQMPGEVCKHLVFMKNMPAEALSTRVPRLNVRDSRRLHIARDLLPNDTLPIVHRAIAGMATGSERVRIVDAWVEGDNLVVLPPSFDRLTIPVKDLQRYIPLHGQPFRDFEIDEDGSYLYWPAVDVHLGWEQLQGIVDPTLLVSAQKESAAFRTRYGDAIRSLRESCGLRQSDVERIAERHLRRIERGEIAPSSRSLKALATGHGMRPDKYMAEIAKRL